THLTFNGQCEAAFRFYAQCLKGRIEAMVPHAGTPAAQHVPTNWRNKILHARLNIGQEVLMGADVPPGCDEDAQGISVALQFTDVAEAERAFRALADKGRVQMPIQQTFWAARFGTLIDQFGIPWMIKCELAAAA